MFDDFLDPIATARRLEQERFLRNAKLAQESGQKVEIQPLESDQERSVLGKIGSGLLGGLGYAGSVLEKTFGARAIRGALGGKPRELLSVLPLSDTLGITDEADRVSGRDLLRQHDLIDKEDNWGNFAAGLALEIGTDPSSWITGPGRALTKAGEVASKAGVLPKGVRLRMGTTLDDALKGADPAARASAEIAAGGAEKLAALGGERLGGLFGTKIPFSELFGVQATPRLVGDAGLKVLDDVSRVGSAVARGDEYLRSIPYLGQLYKLTPPGMVGSAAPSIGRGLDYSRRYLGSLFDASKFGAIEEAGQKAAAVRHAEILPFQAKYLERAAEYGDELKRLGVTSADELRLAQEGIKPHSIGRVNEIAQAMRDDYLEMLQEAQKLGLNVKEYADPLSQTLQYGPRQWSRAIEEGGGFGGSSAAALAARSKGLQTGRSEILEGFAEGTAGINKLIQDAAAYGDASTRGARAKHILDNYLRPAQQIVDERLASGTLTTANAASELKAVQRLQSKQAKELTKFIDDLPDAYAQSASGLLKDAKGEAIKLTAFGNNPIDEYMQYVRRFADMRARGLAAQDLLASNYLSGAADLPKGAVSLSKALKDAGLTDSITYAKGVDPARVGATASLLERINKDLAAQGKSTLSSISDLYIDPKIYADLTRINKAFQAPESVGKAVGVFDKITDLIKTHLTSYWPSFHTRNLTSGQVMNLIKGGLDPLGDVGKAYKIGAGGVWEGLENIPVIRAALEAAGKPVTAEEATKQLARWQFAYGVGGGGRNIGRDLLTSTGDTLKGPRSLEDALSSIVGQTPKSFTEVGKILAGKADDASYLSPLAESGAKWNPVVAGRMVGDIVENMNRSPLMVSYLRQGYSPAEAARRTIAGHYDYTAAALTPFERNVMKRLVPFYTFSRFNIPNILGELASNPGGVAGLTARLAYNARPQGDFIPEYLSGTLALPIGDRTEAGHQRYLTGLGLPTEQAFDLIKGTTGKDPLAAAGLSVLNQMNPLIKAPLEYFVGKQFMSGRELDTLRELTGNRLADQALYASPASRWITAGRQFMDPRKDLATLLLNLGTGTKLTDVDLKKEERMAELEYIKNKLKGDPAIKFIESMRVRPEMISSLSPEELELLQLQKLLEKRFKEESKAKKELQGR